MRGGAVRDPDGFAAIADYGLLGDERTAALVCRDGSVDWLCVPTFSDPPLFAALLDPSRGGSFRLAPTEDHEVERRYLPDTNVLETTFHCGGGDVIVTDALTVPASGSERWRELIRRIECVSGEAELSYDVAPRFGWDQEACEPALRDGAITFQRDGTSLLMQVWGCPEPRVDGPDARGTISLARGDVATFALTAFDGSPMARFSRPEIERRLDETCDYWRGWVARCDYDGPWRDAVIRSALALGALVHAPSGGIVAAPTSSLPERIGGDRNYDYRLCWVRDSAFALEAMLELGYRTQVHASLTWMLNAIERSSPRVDVVYGLDGSPPGDMVDVGLRGYRDSKPVHDGNAAAKQLQLGGYGDVMQTAHLFVADGNSLDPASGRALGAVADRAGQIWRSEDAGMWELPEARDFTQGKLAVWLALDRAIGLAEAGELEAPDGSVESWRREREEIEIYIEERCFSEDAGAYMQEPGSEVLDADMLVAVRVGYPHPDRLRATVERIIERLCPHEGSALMYRFEGMEDREGTFVACSFWLIEALARLGDTDRAQPMMEEMAGRSNDLGLYSEEIDPGDGSFLGNFPQALSHLALITAASSLARDR